MKSTPLPDERNIGTGRREFSAKIFHATVSSWSVDTKDLASRAAVYEAPTMSTSRCTACRNLIARVRVLDYVLAVAWRGERDDDSGAKSIAQRQRFESASR